MVKADFSGNYLNTLNTPDNTIITIIGKPEIEEKEGNFGAYLETSMEVEFLDKKKIYTPSRDTGIRLVSAWGEEMDAWVGKQITIKHVLKKVKGETKAVPEGYPVK